MTASEQLPLHRLDVPAPATLPFAIGTFDTIGPLARATFPHRHTFYEIAYVSQGSGAHVVDLATCQLHPPQLCVILPGQMHFWDRVSDLDGWVILFDEDFLLDHPGDRDTLRELGSRACLPLDGATSGLDAIVADMRAEFGTGADGFVSVLRAYLHVLIVRAARLPGRPTGGAASRPAAVAQEFTHLLAQQRGSRLAAREYAARIGVSVAYLHEAVKQVTGATPGQLIRQAHTLEAKRLLSGTAMTIRQVAREVGFTDPAYFSRFFRRETGITPGAFRRDDRGKHNDLHIESIDHQTSAE